MKKTLCLILIFMLLQTTLVSANTTNVLFSRGAFCKKISDTLLNSTSIIDVSAIDNPFSDLSSDEEYYEAVLWMTTMGSMKGYGDGTLRPDHLITNAEVAKILTTMLFGSGFEVPENVIYPPNVSENYWYAKYAWKAIETGIMLNINNWHDHTYENDIDYTKLKEYFDNSKPYFIVDGKNVNFANNSIKPIVKDEVLMVPASAFFEAIDENAEIETSQDIINVKIHDTAISLQINSNTLYKNGETYSLYETPCIINDIIYLPARNIAETLGAQVYWYPSISTMSIKYPENNFVELPLTRGSLSNKIVEVLEIDVDVSDIENPFTDMKPGEQYYDACTWMYHLGYLLTYDDGSFSPNNKMTNAEISVILTKMVFGTFSVPDTEEISNQYNGHWASVFLWKAADSGLTIGIDASNAGAYAKESSINFDLFKKLMDANLSSGTFYTEHYYLENADGNGYSVYEKEYFPANFGSSVSASEKIYSGFTENADLGTHTGIVTKDNSLVLSRYYKRNIYDVELIISPGTSMTIKGKYGTQIELPTPTYNGKTFNGWYSDSLYNNKVDFFEMPLNGTTLYANWQPVNTENEYIINKIIIRDLNNYSELSQIPSSNFIAEVNVTNLSSTDTDTIIIVSYDSKGRMKSINYLYSNLDIEKTGVFGTLINNPNGTISEVKAFVWPSLFDIQPLSEYKSYKNTK